MSHSGPLDHAECILGTNQLCQDCAPPFECTAFSQQSTASVQNMSALQKQLSNKRHSHVYATPVQNQSQQQHLMRSAKHTKSKTEKIR